MAVIVKAYWFRFIMTRIQSSVSGSSIAAVFPSIHLFFRRTASANHESHRMSFAIQFHFSFYFVISCRGSTRWTRLASFVRRTYMRSACRIVFHCHKVTTSRRGSSVHYHCCDYLWPPYGIGRPIIFVRRFLLLSFSFFFA